MTPFFSSTFWALTFCDIHFCNWKLSKFIFMGSHLCSILVCKIPEFWRWKLWDQNFVPFGLGNIHNKESKKPGFNFSIELKAKLCLIWWSILQAPQSSKTVKPLTLFPLLGNDKITFSRITCCGFQRHVTS